MGPDAGSATRVARPASQGQLHEPASLPDPINIMLTSRNPRAKKGGAGSAAKFREETSKKHGGIAAVLRCTMGGLGGECKRNRPITSP
jgi:hypothetical protein